MRAADGWSTRDSGRRERVKVGGFHVGIGRSTLPGRSRPAQETRQRRPLHALVRPLFWHNTLQLIAYCGFAET